MSPRAGAGAAVERLVSVVDRFPRRKVAVLVDLVVDEFVHGEIERVSREAPVLILREGRTSITPGGGGNAVANLRALDAEPLPVGLVGRDPQGDALLGRFGDLGIRTSSILRDARYRTPVKSRILAGGVHTRRQQVVRVDRGAAPGPVGAKTGERVVRKLQAALGRADGVLVADYGYGVATPEHLRRAIAGRRRDVPVTVDSRFRVASYRGVTACTPNQEELELALHREPLRDERAIEHAGRALLRRCRARALLLTRGPRGVSLFEPRRRALHVPPFGSDEVADVTGAGDTVIAVFSLAILAGADFADAARLANYAAGLVVMKAGTATITRAELTSAVREDLAS